MISHCRGLLFLQPVHLKLHKIWANIQKVEVYVTGNLKGNLHRILLWYFFMQLHWKMKAQWSRAGNSSSEVHNSNRIRTEGIRQWAYQIHECTMQIYSKCCKLGERDAAIHMSIMNLELSPAFSCLSILKWSLCQIGHRRASQQSQQQNLCHHQQTSKGSISMFTTFLPKLIGSCIGKVPPSSWYFTHKLFNHLVWCVIWRKWRSQTICMLCEEVQHMSLLNSSAKTKVDIVTLFYILLFVHWCTNDSRARDWATHDFWRSWRWIKCKGIFMTLCKTRDVLLLEPKEVGGLARWRSSFNPDIKRWF